MQQAVVTTLPGAVLEEAGLVESARGGDRSAFERLYRLSAPSVYGLCLRLTHSVAEAQDCTQETFVRAWQQLAEFRGDSRFRTWIHRIAVNEVFGRKRRHSLEHRHLTVLDSETSSPSSDTATLVELERAITNLPERAREIFVLYAIYGHSHDEIASMLDIVAGTSKAQLHRARKLLAGALFGEAAEASE